MIFFCTFSVSHAALDITQGDTDIRCEDIEGPGSKRRFAWHVYPAFNISVFMIRLEQGDTDVQCENVGDSGCKRRRLWHVRVHARRTHWYENVKDVHQKRRGASGSAGWTAYRGERCCRHGQRESGKSLIQAFGRNEDCTFCAAWYWKYNELL